MNLLEEILARAASSAPTDYGVAAAAPAAKKNMSLIERLFGQQALAAPSAQPGASPFPPVATAPPQMAPPQMAAQPPITAPGIGGLGNMDPATTRAPTSPVDPNYAAPESDTEQRLQAMVQPSGAKPPLQPLPRARPREADGTISPEPARVPTDITSAARGPAAEEEQATAPSTQQRPQMAQPSLWDNVGSLAGKVMGGLHDNSNLLLALGAGFAGAPNIGQGISRASQFAIPASQQDLKNRMTVQNQSQTYRAMIEAGVPPQQAMAAIGNPELQKRLLDSYITDRKSEIKTVKSKDMFGNETERLVSVNPYDGTSKEITGKPGSGSAPASGAAPAPGGTSGTFAPGVTMENFDHSKSGDEYLAQFSPEVQAGVKKYINGESLPTGRQQAAQAIKYAGQKYADDMGLPSGEQAFNQKKVFKNSLADTKSGVGLQVKGFQQGLSHAAALAENIVKLKNWNGLGSVDLAHLANNLRARGVGQADVVKQVESGAQALSGEVGKLFSGASGGGVHERQATAGRFAGNLAGPEAAGALESTLELMQGGLSAVNQTRDRVFGPGADKVAGLNFIGPEEQKNIARIQAAIKTLRGETAEPSSSHAGVVAPPPGRYVFDPATRTMKPLQ